LLNRFLAPFWYFRAGAAFDLVRLIIQRLTIIHLRRTIWRWTQLPLLVARSAFI
jgi:hypothetical protein